MYLCNGNDYHENEKSPKSSMLGFLIEKLLKQNQP